ncbi:MAG: PVC-type heme-binding CxxCH protein [Bryobacteraceae bacterium]
MKSLGLLATASLAMAQMTAPLTVKGLKTAPGLEVTLWASEPMVTNPTDIDIDEKGRIWYLEAVNYRRKLKGLPDLRKSDRIIILEDTDGDGKADTRKIFAEDVSLRAPIGIAVLGNKVYVSQSPDLVVYTKDDQDRVVSREVLLTGWGGIDHDHGLHAVTFGHDGRLYFNSGDQGFDVTDKSGNRFVSSQKGPYYAGCALRMNPDGTGFKVLAHNFRNPYELAMDSFGSIWQSDNDDDGNAWTRFNYVMEGGNYGYWGPGGRRWREDRGTHFHQENPGVVPNIARLGAGSPCGLIIYEGSLLPEKYRHQPIHAEAGKRAVNTYLIERAGAGYGLTTEPTTAAADTWFRPSDVAMGPDGAVYIADWYDPGVGGHNMGDTARGRIYRLAPTGYKTRKVPVNLDTEEGLAAALGSPTQSIRYLAFMRLREQGSAALPTLLKMWQSSDPIARARSLWLIGASGAEGRATVEGALRESDERFRMLGLRVMHLNFPKSFLAASEPLWTDPSPAVRREVAVLMQHYQGPEAAKALVALARGYDGKDRWYLEALGIGMEGKEQEMVSRLERAFPGPWDSRLAAFFWRMRAPETLPGLVAAAGNEQLATAQRIEAMEAVAVQKEEAAMTAVAGMVSRDSAPAELRRVALERLTKRLFSEWTPYRTSQKATEAVEKALATPALRKAALDFVEDLEDPRFGPAVAKLAQDGSLGEPERVVAIQAVGKTKSQEFVPMLTRLSQNGPLPIRLAAVRAIGSAQPPDLEARFRRLILSKEPNELRSEALRSLVRSTAGANLVLDLEQKQELPAELRNLASSQIAFNRDPAVRTRAAKILPPPVSRAKTKLPPPRSLAAQQGDAASGKRVFFSKTGPNCASCHAVEEGKPTIGPNLADIGTKLGKEAMVDSILNPSAGIAHEYVSWILDTKTQGQVIGILAEDTPQRVVVKTETGEAIRVRPADITARRKSNLSMMPEDLVTKMTEHEFVNLLEYLTTLRSALQSQR